MRGSKAKKIRRMINQLMTAINPGTFRLATGQIINPKQARYRKIKSEV